jgi:hypothetical protein
MSDNYQRLPGIFAESKNLIFKEVLNVNLESPMNQPFPKDLENNWRTGIYQSSVHDVGGDYHDFDMDDNYVACMQSRINGLDPSFLLKMFDRRSMTVAKVATSKCLYLNKNLKLSYLGNSTR